MLCYKGVCIYYNIYNIYVMCVSGNLTYLFRYRWSTICLYITVYLSTPLKKSLNLETTAILHSYSENTILTETAEDESSLSFHYIS